MKQIAVGLLCLLAADSVSACTYCLPDSKKLQTLREDASTSKFVLIGSLGNARIVGEDGFTDLTIQLAVRNHPTIENRKVVTLPRWTLIDPKKPAPRMLVFFDVYEGRIDPFRAVELKGNGMADYLKGALALDARNRPDALKYFAKHLDHPDPEIAADAFLEFAKSADAEVSVAAKGLDAKLLRRLVADPRTPSERLGLYCYMLGACGSADDTALLRRLLIRPDDRISGALSGILGGLIEADAAVGWAEVAAVAGDENRKFNDRFAALNTVRFYLGSRPETVRKQASPVLEKIVRLGDMADMAVEDLRRRRWWESAAVVLQQFDKPTHASPLVRRAIVRYALSCPEPNAAEFVKQLRRSDPKLLADVEESLSFESAPPAKPKP